MHDDGKIERYRLGNPQRCVPGTIGNAVQSFAPPSRAALTLMSFCPAWPAARPLSPKLSELRSKGSAHDQWHAISYSLGIGDYIRPSRIGEIRNPVKKQKSRYPRELVTAFRCEWAHHVRSKIPRREFRLPVISNLGPLSRGGPEVALRGRCHGLPGTALSRQGHNVRGTDTFQSNREAVDSNSRAHAIRCYFLSLASRLRCGHGFLHALDFDRRSPLILSTADAFHVALEVSIILRKRFALVSAGILLWVGRMALGRLPLARCKAYEDHENSHRRSTLCFKPCSWARFHRVS